MAAGMFYYLAPRLWNTKLHSTSAANMHFWIGLVGILLYIASMWVSGMTQGLMLSATTRQRHRSGLSQFHRRRHRHQVDDVHPRLRRRALPGWLGDARVEYLEDRQRRRSPSTAPSRFMSRKPNRRWASLERLPQCAGCLLRAAGHFRHGLGGSPWHSPAASPLWLMVITVMAALMHKEFTRPVLGRLVRTAAGKLAPFHRPHRPGRTRRRLCPDHPHHRHQQGRQRRRRARRFPTLRSNSPDATFTSARAVTSAIPR